MMSSVLHKLKFDMAYVDCCDTNQTRFGQLISDLISERDGKSFTVGEKNPLVRSYKERTSRGQKLSSGFCRFHRCESHDGTLS